MTTEASTYTAADLWLPRLCVVNSVTTATMTGSTEAAGYEAVAARGPQTYTGWKPTAVTATLLATFTGAADVDYVGIYILTTGGCTFRPQYWNGSTYVNLGADVTPTEVGPVLWLFNSVNTSRIRINVTGGSTMPVIATLKAGEATVFPNGMPPGYKPSYLNPQDELTNSFSQGGQILGSELVSSKAREEVNIDKLEASWVETNWPGIRDAMRTEGAFFAWNADDYPAHLIYGGLMGVPVADYSDNLNMHIQFALEGPRVL
jgi:hypothetical protein